LEGKKKKGLTWGRSFLQNMSEGGFNEGRGWDKISFKESVRGVFKQTKESRRLCWEGETLGREKDQKEQYDSSRGANFDEDKKVG